MNELKQLLKEQKKVKYKTDLTELMEINRKIFALREKQRKEHEAKIIQAREERLAKKIEKKCFEIQQREL